MQLQFEEYGRTQGNSLDVQFDMNTYLLLDASKQNCIDLVLKNTMKKFQFVPMTVEKNSEKEGPNQAQLFS